MMAAAVGMVAMAGFFIVFGVFALADGRGCDGHCAGCLSDCDNHIEGGLS